MIKFSRLFDLTTDVELQRFAEAADLFRTAFAYETEALPRIENALRHHRDIGYDPLFLIALDSRNHVTGFAFAYYFPEIRYAYLQYIASDPARAQRGIGTALYEALREFLGVRRARGLLLDVPPADPAKLKDKSRAAINRRRLRFYARYDIQEVAGTHWDVEANPRNEYYLTTLLYDPLGKRPRLERADARRIVRRILVEQYRYQADDPFVDRIVRSFRDDPVKLVPVAQVATRSRPRVAPSAPDEPSPGGKPGMAPSVGKPTRGKYTTPIKLIVVERHTIHHLREKGYVERPVRVSAILRGLEGLAIERLPTRTFAEEHLTAVHHPAMVGYLKAMAQTLDAKAIVYPEVFPIRRPDRIPRALEDRAGYYCVDTFTPLTRNTYPAARDAANVALTGAEQILRGERLVFSLCRPPGHHAERRVYGGFCFFNNSAIAAHYLSRRGKVALLDIDYHHGNGAQDIFYQRADVLTVSIHGHPSHAYPNFSGYADERGEGAGKGFNLNLPLDPPVDDERYLSVLDRALSAIRRFDPAFLVVSLGFDIMRGDPTGSFAVSVNGMGRIGRRIGRFGRQVLIVQEGGYAIGNLRTGSHAFFEALASAWYE